MTAQHARRNRREAIVLSMSRMIATFTLDSHGNPP